MRQNNLKANEEDVMHAIRLLNEVGGRRPPWGLPHLLPGINLLYGLPGESKRTLDYNLSFLERLLKENLIVRRINIRQVIGFPGTRMGSKRKSTLKRHAFFRHKKQIRESIDSEMIRRVAPYGTIIRSAFVEKKQGNTHLLRPLGTYPPLCFMPVGPTIDELTDIFVVDHGPRSLSVLPYPLEVSKASLTQWKAVPGVGAKRAARIKGAKTVVSAEQLENLLELELPNWLTRSLSFAGD